MKGLHHLHLRKRKARGTEPYPARNPWLRVLDRVVLIAGIVGPATSLPQALKIYLLKDASSVSTLSWLLPMVLDIPWIIYGIVHRERPIVVAYCLWFSVNLLVVIGAFWYGAGLF